MLLEAFSDRPPCSPGDLSLLCRSPKRNCLTGTCPSVLKCAVVPSSTTLWGFRGQRLTAGLPAPSVDLVQLLHQCLQSHKRTPSFPLFRHLGTHPWLRGSSYFLLILSLNVTCLVRSHTQDNSVQGPRRGGRLCGRVKPSDRVPGDQLDRA